MKSVALSLALVVGLGACNQEPPTPAEEGRNLARTEGCLSCHSSDGSGGTGPTWKGLFSSERELEDGTRVIADDNYLRESMLDPSSKTVKGFPADLMETVIKPNSLNNDQVEALIAYIKTLS